jgi:integrase
MRVTMSRQTSKLNSLAVQRTKRPGRYADGGGLYLQVSKFETKSWLFRFMLNGKAREMGLGPLSLVSLAEARAKALDCRRSLLESIDPIEARKAKRQGQKLEAAKSVTFDYCAAAYIESHRAGWKSAKHAEQWKNSLVNYASPVLGRLPIQNIDTGLVMRVIGPIWGKKTETASRLRNRIELILGWATAQGYRSGENPARWRGHLDKLLPKRSSVQQVKHYAAMPIDEISAFMDRLRSTVGVSARALEFLILTVTRTTETLGARWEEVDFQNATWTIPSVRMKAKKTHRIPLAQDALKVLELQRLTSHGQYIFRAKSGDNPLSGMALLSVLHRMEIVDTTHGFRSTFRDWAAERTNFPREVVEMALAHTIGDKVEAAYRRGDLFKKRGRLMAEWAKFCSLKPESRRNQVPCIHSDATTRLSIKKDIQLDEVTN